MSKKWINHLGQEVPTAYVPTIDKKKDRMARKYLKKAKAISEKLAKFKSEIEEEADALYDEMLEDAKVRTGKKGNFTISSFDKEIKIEADIQERIEFSDNIKLAQAKFDEFINIKTKDADADLIEMINHAFKTSKGRLDTKRVLSLFSYKINHKVWKEGIELLKQSIDRNISKRYIRIQEKDQHGDYQNIQLNFSAL